jgi:hypothetical protein
MIYLEFARKIHGGSASVSRWVSQACSLPCRQVALRAGCLSGSKRLPLQAANVCPSGSEFL